MVIWSLDNWHWCFNILNNLPQSRRCVCKCFFKTYFCAFFCHPCSKSTTWRHCRLIPFYRYPTQRRRIIIPIDTHRRYVISSLITAYRTTAGRFGEDSRTRPSVIAYVSTRPENHVHSEMIFRVDLEFFFILHFFFPKRFQSNEIYYLLVEPMSFFLFIIVFFFLNYSNDSINIYLS